VSEVNWSEQENIRILHTSSQKRRVLQSGFFVMDLDQDEDLWALMPKELRDFMRAEKLSLDLPASSKAHSRSIVLDRDRSGLAQKGQYIETLQIALLAAVCKAAARQMSEGSWHPRGLPQDYLYRPEHLTAVAVSQPMHRLADALNGNRWDDIDLRTVSDLLTNDPDGSKLAHLIAAIEFNHEGRQLSLYQLRRELHGEKITQDAAPAVEKIVRNLPKAMSAMAHEAIGTYSHLVGPSASDDIWTYENPSTLSQPEQHARQLLANLILNLMTDLYQSRNSSIPPLSSIARLDSGLLNAKHFYTPPPYQVGFGSAGPKLRRLGIMGKGWLSLNASGVSKWLDWIVKAEQGQTTPEEDHQKLFEILENVVHEDSHAWEPGTEETHNTAFLERMRSSLVTMAKQGVNPENVLRQSLRQP
jgi:hypothetical protein